MAHPDISSDTPGKAPGASAPGPKLHHPRGLTRPAMLVRRRRWLDRASGLRRRRPGGCDMGSLGPTQLIALLLAVAIVAATGGFVASAIARTNKRRTRRLFLLGFVCGLTAGAVLRGRRRSLHAWRGLDGRHRSRGTSLLTGPGPSTSTRSLPARRTRRSLPPTPDGIDIHCQ